MKTKLMLVGMVGISLVLSACGGGKKEMSYGPNDRRDRGPVVTQPPPPPPKPADHRPAKPAKWTRIARADMPYASSPNRLSLSVVPASYGELQFVTGGPSVMLMDVQVIFTDHTQWTVTMNQRFKKGDSTHTLRLPALRRPVERVFVTYRTLDNKGKATLTINAR